MDQALTRALKPFAMLVLVFVHTWGCSTSNQPVLPEAQEGILDLSEWNLGEHGPVALHGDWRFAWNRTVKPGPLTEVWPTIPSSVKVGQILKGQVHPEASGGMLPVHGYGTYVLRIKLPTPTPRQLAFLLPPVCNSALYSFTDSSGVPLGPPIHQGVFATTQGVKEDLFR